MTMISNFLFNFINFFVILSFFLSSLLTSGILFSTAVRAVVLAKLLILVISALTSFILALKVTSAKKLTSQDVSSEAQVKNFFILEKNYVLFSRYSSFCIFNHAMIYQICDVTMSIRT